jgi:hypothetical protein
VTRILVTNGDHAATALSAHFPGADILIWRDVLIEGPVPGGIDDDELADIRARYIEQAFGLNDVRSDFTRRDQRFTAISNSDDVELWFESDLHDQLQIIQFLTRVDERKLAASLKLTLAQPPLSNHVDAMAKKLLPVAQDHVRDAAMLWHAFRSANPEALLAATQSEGALPEAHASFARLLEEYPSPFDGLGRIERSALLAIRDGAITPGLAFRHYQQTETLPFLGDLGFYYRLDALQNCAKPLLHGLPEGGIARAANSNMSVEYTHTPLELTDTGRAVLERRADFIALNGIDRWLGGVHLERDNVWRFDPERRALVKD